MKLCSFAFLLVFAFNCSADTWPDWVTSSNKDDEYITAVGIDKSRSAAKQAAIADITTQLSIDVNTRQLQTLKKQNNRVNNYFEQTTSLTSLPVTLTGLEELNSVNQNNLFALKVGIKKATLIANLQSDLEALHQIVAPQKNVEQRFIWALKMTGELNLASKKLALLEHLSGSKPFIKSTLNKLLQAHSFALDAVACDVIGANNISQIKSALSDALPHSGSTRLWVRPQLQWQFAHTNGKYLAKANLTIALTRSVSPFKVLLQHDISAQESASTREIAKQSVINNLVKQIKAPASQWLFNN
ncbi:MAG: LPP20 family lipoprotein [Pseudoalteromonas tetraodonis]|nr:LPP20 family lipoprotein [Pseudoalteromonas tetraodonis]